MPLHPLDRFRAFLAIREKSRTEDATAIAFFVDARVVKQRLRLVSVSPALPDIYAEDDGMTLEQPMVFTVSDERVMGFSLCKQLRTPKDRRVQRRRACP